MAGRFHGIEINSARGNIPVLCSRSQQTGTAASSLPPVARFIAGKDDEMKRRVFIIGIGAGNPDFVTIQAINAMNQVDVFFIPDKGLEKGELARVRREIIERYVKDRSFRTVPYQPPVRASDKDYQAAVDDWKDAVEETFGRLIM